MSEQFDRLVGALGANRPPVLVSSQLPIGTCAAWEARHPDVPIAVQPENIRKRHAEEDFAHQERMVVGYRFGELWGEWHLSTVRYVLSAFTSQILFMSPESAEMSKHVLNAWLATQIAFANEAADLCRGWNADVDDVFRALRLDRRVGTDAPLLPGAPYSGGTLGRDIRILLGLGIRTEVIEGVNAGNRRRLREDAR